GVHDHRDARHAVDGQADGDAELGPARDERACAIDGIDDPHGVPLHALGRVGCLLGEPAVLRPRTAQPLAQQCIRGEIRLGEWLVGGLVTHTQRTTDVAAHDVRRRTCRLERKLQVLLVATAPRVVLHAHRSSSCTRARATRSGTTITISAGSSAAPRPSPSAGYMPLLPGRPSAWARSTVSTGHASSITLMPRNATATILNTGPPKPVDTSAALSVSNFGKS